MSLGMLIEDCENVVIRGNRFHNIDRPVVIKRTKGISADDNIANYDNDYFRLAPLTVAIRRIINE